MKLTDEFEDSNDKARLPVLYMAVGAIAFIALIVAIVVSMNMDKSRSKKTSSTSDAQTSAALAQTEQSTESDILKELGVGESTLTSDQLDFWNMYQEDESVSDNNTIAMGGQYEKNAQKLLEEEQEKETEEDLSEGGTKTMVTRPDGTEQWVMINAYLAKNSYQDTGFVYEEPVLKYYEGGAKTSHLGVDIDEDTGSVDFSQLKKAGVEFVMNRLGYRGYESGTLMLDEAFYNNMQAEEQNGLKRGVYFQSQAVTVEEAQEEAQLVIDYVSEMQITYPIAISLGLVANDSSRIDAIPKKELTEITNAFCAMIKEAGYTPAVYGNKYWLLRKIDLTQLGDYDIWLSQDGEIPDYPYQFTMWQYAQSANISGITGEARLNISFVDYSQR